MICSFVYKLSGVKINSQTSNTVLVLSFENTFILIHIIRCSGSLNTSGKEVIWLDSGRDSRSVSNSNQSPKSRGNWIPSLFVNNMRTRWTICWSDCTCKYLGKLSIVFKAVLYLACAHSCDAEETWRLFKKRRYLPSFSRSW